jgi:cobalt/nickel transport system permease protein
MALAHLTVAGFAEFVLTAGIVAYLQRANLPLLRINHPGIVDTDAELAPQSGRPALRWALIGIATMVVLSPLGLLAPGGAFGEDAPADINLHKYGLSAIPSGLQHYNGFWKHTLLGDYGFSSGRHADLGYVLSAILGALAVGTAIFLFIGSVRLVARRRPAAPAGEA